MQQQSIARLFVVQRLYRRVLKLHRYLPADLKKLGDGYAKDEFRRNKSANQIQAYEFMNEWKAYCNTLAKQVGAATAEVGENLDDQHLESLSQDQLGQIYALQQETLGRKKDEAND